MNGAAPSTPSGELLERAAHLGALHEALRGAADGRGCLVLLAGEAGVRADPWLLAEVVAGDADGVDECLAAGLLQLQDGVPAFRHELVRAALLEAMSPVRAMSVHRSVLDPDDYMR